MKKLVIIPSALLHLARWGSEFRAFMPCTALPKTKGEREAAFYASVAQDYKDQGAKRKKCAGAAKEVPCLVCCPMK